MSTVSFPTTPDSGAPAAAPDAAASTSHPRGLYVLFATEMWERFSYYGMRALLVLYLVNHLKWRPSEASATYKWYTSLVYLTPLLGGFLADRFLGVRAAIIVGGVLMAIGHFLMAFEPLPFFYAALAFLIFGNGFFKPNISTLVGRMYGPNDARRDGAFTIFYMGINLGAFMAPLLCGWLAESYGYHYGFGAAGVGMVIGLATFLGGQHRVLGDVAAVAHLHPQKAADAVEHAPEASESVPRAGGFAGLVANALPFVFLAIAVLVPIQSLYGYFVNGGKLVGVFMPVAFAAVAGFLGITLLRIKGAARDKSSVIFILFAASVLFWMAFEQAGNALNLWAEFNTDRHLGGFGYPAAWYQSVNPLLIFTIAPLFAAVWVWLERKGYGLSTPAKMLVALVLMAASFVAMVGGAMAEQSTVSTTALSALPPGLARDAEGKVVVESSKQPLHAGLLTFDPTKNELAVRGVLPPFARKDALATTVPAAYSSSVARLVHESADATDTRPVEEKLSAVPEVYEFPLPVIAPAALAAERASDDPKDDSPAAVARRERWSVAVSGWDPATATLTMHAPLNADQVLLLTEAAAPSTWRSALRGLEKSSEAARVSGIWLLLSYLLATLGELCISPVGLSMVTKLSPARYASLFMGVWLLSSSVAQYVGGTLGEQWGEITPTSYFWIFVWTSVAGALALALLVRPLKRLMHDVK
jgi:POT family proton-dependent oligopeptide transporter